MHMPPDDRVLKEMKVRIPESQHIKLHGIRLVTDQGISETVQKALENFFEGVLYTAADLEDEP